MCYLYTLHIFTLLTWARRNRDPNGSGSSRGPPSIMPKVPKEPTGRKKWNRPPDIYIYICYIIYLFIYYISYIWCCPTRMELIPNGITGCVRCRFLTKHIQNISISANGPNSLVMVSVLSGSYTGRIVGHF